MGQRTKRTDVNKTEKRQTGRNSRLESAKHINGGVAHTQEADMQLVAVLLPIM